MPHPTTIPACCATRMSRPAPRRHSRGAKCRIPRQLPRVAPPETVCSGRIELHVAQSAASHASCRVLRHPNEPARAASPFTWRKVPHPTPVAACCATRMRRPAPRRHPRGANAMSDDHSRASRHLNRRRVTPSSRGSSGSAAPSAAHRASSGSRAGTAARRGPPTDRAPTTRAGCRSVRAVGAGPPMGHRRQPDAVASSAP